MTNETKMRADREWERQKMEFEKALELRKFEIENFWKRGWFFGVLLLALIGSYYSLSVTDFKGYIAFIALLVSFAQSLMNRGSKYWQERWEYVTKNRESILGIDVTKTRKYHFKEFYYDKSYIDRSILAKNENRWIRSKRFSVSKIAILVWDIITIFCLFLWLNTFPLELIKYISSNSEGWDCIGISHCTFLIKITHSAIFKPLIFHLTIIIYLFFIIRWNGGISENLLNSKVGEPQSRNEHYGDSEDFIEAREGKLNEEGKRK